MAVKITLEQRRSRHAWTAVQAVKGSRGKIDAGDYLREAKRLSVRIMTSGLGHAIAFLNAKGTAASNDARNQLTGDIARWLLKERGLGRGESPFTGATLIHEIVSRDASFLRRTTDEALSYLQWLTRFAEAEFSEEDGSGDRQ